MGLYLEGYKFSPVGEKFSLRLLVDGLDEDEKPLAVIGEFYEIFAPSDVITFDRQEARLEKSADGLKESNSGEVSFLASNGFQKIGIFKIKVQSVISPTKNATIEVEVQKAFDDDKKEEDVMNPVNTKPVEGEVDNKEKGKVGVGEKTPAVKPVKPVPVESATPNTYAFGKLLLIVAVVLYLGFLAFLYLSPTQPKTIEKVAQVPSAKEQAPQPETPPVAVLPPVAPTPTAVEKPKVEEPKEESKTETRRPTVWVEVE